MNGQRVRTNSFGRTILMAGLLSVSWHMNQRDLSITTLGAQPLAAVTDGEVHSFELLTIGSAILTRRSIEATATSPDYPTPLSRSLVPRPIETRTSSSPELCCIILRIWLLTLTLSIARYLPVRAGSSAGRLRRKTQQRSREDHRALGNSRECPGCSILRIEVSGASADPAI